MGLCYGGMNRRSALLAFADKLSLTTHLSEIIKRQIIYIQNLEDTHRVKEHYEPFCAALSSGTDDNGGR